MISKEKWLVFSTITMAVLNPVHIVRAQYVQNAIAVPSAPGCPAGTTWTKTGTYYTCQLPTPPYTPPQQTPPPAPPGKTLTASKSIQVYTDGQGYVGGDNSEGGNASGNCEAIATVTEDDYSDGSIVYSQLGQTVTITTGSRLYAVDVPGTCNIGNH